MTEREDTIDFPAYEIPEPRAGAVDDIVRAAMAAQPASRARRVWPLVGGGAVAIAAAVLLVVILRGDRDAARVAVDDAPLDNPDSYRAPIDPVERVRKREDGKLVHVMADAAERARLMRAIEYARERRMSGKAPSPSRSTAGGGATGGEAVLDKATIKEAMAEVQPLLVECYSMALETQPDLSGRIVAGFRIVGEPEVGGLVAEVELESDDGMTEHADFAECLRETIYSLELPAPVGGGEISVKYPFLFRNDADTDGDDGPTHKLADTVAERLTAARDHAKAGEWGHAFMTCQSALADQPDNQEAVMICALSACNIKNPAWAERYIAQLRSRPRRGMAIQICRRNGIEIAEPE